MAEKKMMTGIFLVKSLNCGFGGMETHQRAFISNYVYDCKSNVIEFPYVIENNRGTFIFNAYMNGHFLYKLEFSYLNDLIKYLYEKLSFNVIFLNDGWWIESVASFRSAFPLCQIYMRSGGNDVELAPWNSGIFSYDQRRLLWKDSINKLDYIIANSDYSVSRLILLGVNQHHIIKIRGGVNNSICLESKELKNGLRYRLINRLGITQKFILIFACRFVPFKGIIQAMKSINKSSNCINCHIIFVGSGNLKQEIETWCKEHLHSHQYTFLGEISNEDTIRTIAASDILVNASLYYQEKSGDGVYIHTETMGRSMMEAISVGTKIIATNVGGTRELFSENKGIGRLIPPESSSLISTFNKLDTIIKEPITQVCEYSWENVFSRYDILFQMISYED